MVVIVALFFSARISASEKIGTIPTNTAETKTEETCYCDIRKQRQVEKRLRKQKELKRGKSESLFRPSSVEPNPVD